MKMNNNSLQGVESRNRLEVVIFFEVLLPPKRIKLIKFYESVINKVLRQFLVLVFHLDNLRIFYM